MKHRNFARELRKNSTKTYEILWEHLRRKALGVRFQRRRRKAGLVPCFYCAKARLLIDIDYGRRSEEEWKERCKRLKNYTYLVLDADEIHSDIEAVLEKVAAAL